MRIPVDLDSDADIVINDCQKMIERLARELDAALARAETAEMDAARYHKLKSLPARFDTGDFIGTDAEFDAALDSYLKADADYAAITLATQPQQTEGGA
jgi:hypothetical protein